MAQQLEALEKTLDDIFRKKAPWQLPEKAKQWIVKYLPIINLVLGVITLWAALTLWRWAHRTEELVNWANDLARTYGGKEITSSRMSFLLWLSLVMLVIQGVIYIAAYPGTKAKQKKGWNLLFYGALIGIVSNVISLFADYRSFSGLLGTLIGAAIGFYFLFQIRPYYLGKKSTEKSK